MERSIMSILTEMMNEETKSFASSETIKLQLNQIEVNPLNNAPIEDIDELAQYIKEDGLKEKPRVYQISNNKYRLLSGERRYRACKQIGITSIEVIVEDKPETEAEELLEIDASNETRLQSEQFLDTRIQLLSKVYDLKKEEGAIPSGTLKRDWISLRMYRKLSPRQIQNYLSGNVKALQAENIQQDKPEKEFDIEKEADKKIKQLIKLYEWICDNQELLSDETNDKIASRINDLDSLVRTYGR